MSHIAPDVDDGLGSNEGPREAMCPLLYNAGEGAIEVITDDDGTFLGERYVRGLCTKVIDCDECHYMQHEIAQHPSDEVTWVCPACIGPIFKWAKLNQIPIGVPGFFSTGLCENPQCQRPGRFSFFRQIVFGQIRS